MTLRVLAARWPSVLSGLLIGAVAAVAVLWTATPLYTAHTRFFVSTSSAEDLAAAVQGSLLVEQRVTSYAEYLRDQQLMSAVIDDLGLSMTPDELSSQVSATVVPDTVILAVSVTDPVPERALAVAESIGTQFQRLVARLETPEGQSQSPVRVTVTAEPRLPTQSDSPDVPLTVALWLGLGLLGGAALALLRERGDPCIRDAADATAITGAPLLGLVPVDTRSRGGILPLTAPWPAPGSAAANALRRLRTNVDYVDAQSPPRVIAVAGSSAREGATTTAVGLAFALARAGRSVILVDADLLRPGVGPFLGLDAGPGLTDVLAGSLDVDRAVRYPVDGGPGVLATGPTPPDAGPPPSAQRMRALFEKLSSAYDVVLIDTPPLVPVAEASELAAVVDGVLLCVRLRTREAELRLALDMLERVDARILGLAVTVPTTRRRGQRRSRIGRHGSERG